MSLERFAPVGLAALVAEAGLLTRFDRKYVVPRAAVDGILAAIDPRTRVLELDGARDFAYASVYFDTPDLLSFRMAAQPRRRRFKLRTRTYVDTSAAYLEIKTRGARGATVKDRVEYDLEDAGILTPAARDEVGLAFTAIGLADDRADDLGAVLRTRYRRATLLAPDGAGRATVDTDLAWDTPDDTGFALADIAVVETKSPGAASALDRTLWAAGYRPVAVSKYATGLAALRPELPRNRWHRLLASSFTPSASLPEEFPWPAAA